MTMFPLALATMLLFCFLITFFFCCASCSPRLLLEGLQTPSNTGGSNNYQLISSPCQLPSARTYHSLSTYSTSDVMVLFGGTGAYQPNPNEVYLDVSNELWTYNATLGSWMQTMPPGGAANQSMNWPSGRAAHSACLLTDPNNTNDLYLVVTMGFSFNTTSSSQFLVDNKVWILDLQDMTWSFLSFPKQPSPRYGAQTTCSANSLFLFSGCLGNTDFASGEPDLWEFSMGTRTWARLANESSQVPEPRCFGGLGLVGSELVLFGGLNSNTTLQPNTWTFDLTSGIWTPSPTNSTPPLAAMSTVVIDGVLYSFGGCGLANGVSLINIYLASTYPHSQNVVWMYVPSTTSWELYWSPGDLATYLTEVPSGRHGASFVFLERLGISYLFGGFTSDAYTFWNDLWAVTPRTTPGFWYTSIACAAAAPPPTGGHSLTAVNGDLYLFGGYSSATIYASTLWRFQTFTQTWYIYQQLSVGPNYRYHHLGVSMNEILFIYAGLRCDMYGVWDYLGDFWAFNTTSSTWTELSSIAYSGTRAAFAGGAYNGSIYFFGGKRDSVALGDFWVITFNSTPNSSPFLVANWSLVQVNSSSQSFGPAARWGHAGAILRDSFAIYGGQNRTYVFADLWLFSFRTNSWTVVSSLPNSGYSTILGIPPPPLTFSTASGFGSKFIVTGGAASISVDPNIFSISSRDLSNLSTQSYMFDIDSMMWMELFMDSEPLARAVHASAILDDWSSAYFYVFGGIAFDLLSDALYQVQLGCNAGYFSSNFSSSPCEPCPKGHFATNAGSASCYGTCPGQTTTADPGSTSEFDCSLCVEDACSRNGACEIGSNFQITCRCNFGYRGSDNCAVAVEIIMIASTCGGTLLLVGIAYVLLRFRRQTKAAYNLLESTQQAVSALEKSWLINWEDIEIANRIDSGSEGAYGEVYLGHWAGRPVAVKRLQESMAMLGSMQASIMSSFEREIKLLRDLRHKNIVFFYGAGEDHGVPFLVTEFISRGSLFAILNNPKVDIDARRRVMFALDVSEGLAFLHGLVPPRVHRDLKSANLLVDHEWNIKIADFGTANLINKLQDPRAPFVEKKKKKTPKPKPINKPPASKNDANLSLRPNSASLKEPLLGTPTPNGRQNLNDEDHAIGGALREDPDSDLTLTRSTVSNTSGQGSEEDLIRTHISFVELNPTISESTGSEWGVSPTGTPQHHDSSEARGYRTALLTARVGTPLWMAPEMLVGMKYSTSADIFSFGIVLWEMLTRRLPYDHIKTKTLIELHNYVEHGGRPELPQHIPKEDLDYILLMQECWDDDPHARPHARELVSRFTAMKQSFLDAPLHFSSPSSSSQPPPIPSSSSTTTTTPSTTTSPPLLDLQSVTINSNN